MIVGGPGVTLAVQSMSPDQIRPGCVGFDVGPAGGVPGRVYISGTSLGAGLLAAADIRSFVGAIAANAVLMFQVADGRFTIYKATGPAVARPDGFTVPVVTLAGSAIAQGTTVTFWVSPSGGTGPQGIQGVQGVKGDRGLVGERGPIGSGIRGAEGPDGQRGPVGETGAPGVGTWRGAWAAGLYSNGDLVEHNGSTWIANTPTTGEPGSSGDWDLVAQRGSDGSNGSNGAAGPGYLATSSSSVAIGAGSKTFAVGTGLAYAVGARVRVASASNPTSEWVEGSVTAYSGGNLTVAVDTFSGSATRSSWTVSLAGEPGQTGAAGGISASAFVDDENDIASSNTEHTIFSTTIAGGALGAHNGYRLKLVMSPVATSSGVTLTLRLKYGSTTMIAMVTSGWNGGPFDVMVEAFVRGLGDSGHQCGYLELAGGGRGGAWADDTAEDSTADKTLALTAQWSVAASGNELLVGQAHAERVQAA